MTINNHVVIIIHQYSQPSCLHGRIPLLILSIPLSSRMTSITTPTYQHQEGP